MFRSGVGFFALFGLGWLLLGVAALPGPARWVAVGAGAVVALVLMLAARRRLPASAGGPLPPLRRRRFGQVNAVQWLLIAGIAVGCGRGGVPELIPPLVALVVGLHFVPLAAVFEQPRLRTAAALLCAVAAAGLVVLAFGGSATQVRTLVGSGCALTLWAMAAWTVRGPRAAGPSGRPDAGGAATAG
ncbi:hypothetical protein [Streptomyces sp. ODS05-4]|uniref:hypothetical protein n=1 Tax=Streptomyces sp. ODS05-4 TaxID=2944939 RepID=UPI0021088F34|nr:hypothetical protein [Streptomyces sp. ODS05-4]